MKESEELLEELIDSIYDLCDACMKSNHLFIIDHLLTTSVTNLDTDIIITYLVATLPIKSKLSNRQSFFIRAELEFKQRNLNLKILNGLE